MSHPQYPQQYGPPPRRRGLSPTAWVLIVGLPLLLLVGCVAVVGVASLSPKDASDRRAGVTFNPPADRGLQTSPAAPQQPQPQKAAVGATVEDGKFAFRVNKIERLAQVGAEPIVQKAQGEFVVVHVSVKNIGDKAQAFSGASQKLYDAAGREYSADLGAAIYVKDSKSLYEPVNPGNQVDGVVLFDVPKGTAITSIELHDSPFSGGVKVRLQ